MELWITTFVTFFVVVDPVANAPMFIALTEGSDEAERRGIAIRAVSVAAVTLVLFAVVGEVMLRSFGLTIAAFRIAGGALLFLLAVEMVFAHDSGLRSMTTGESQEARSRKDVSVFPLAIPMIAGPGAMASMILQTGQHHGEILIQAGVVLVMLVVLALTLAMLLLASRIIKLLGLTGVNVFSRVFGIVLAALAVQYVIDGLRASFPVLS